MGSAGRLMAWDLIEPIIGLPGHLAGAKVIGMKGYRVGITRMGIGMLIALRSGAKIDSSSRGRSWRGQICCEAAKPDRR